MEHRLEDWLEEGYAVSFRTACLILGNRADAEEAVQDAFLRAWRFRDALTSVPSIKPWLYRVVVNSCYSKLRREIPHRDRRTSDAELAERMASSSDPAASAEQAEVAEVVLAALQRLPVSLRVPVVLRYYADLSERDIALAIGRRPGTVKSRLHEARRRLADDPGMLLLGAMRPSRTRWRPDMPTLDDEFLGILLHETGDSFTIPAAGASAILGRIDGDDDERSKGAGELPADSADPRGIGTGAEHQDEPAPAPATRSVRRTIHRTVGAHRVLTVAAAVLILLVVAGGALALGSGAPKVNRVGSSAAPALASPQRWVRGRAHVGRDVGRVGVRRFGFGGCPGAGPPRALHVVSRHDVQGRAPAERRRARRRRGRATGPDRTDRVARSARGPGRRFRTR